MIDYVVEKWPDFLIVGAGKSGTSSLWATLLSHSKIGAPTVKECNFFNREITTRNKSSYRRVFGYFPDDWKTFEASPGYWNPKTINIISKLLPNCKIIFIVRNPIDTLVSAYLHFAGIVYMKNNRYLLHQCLRELKHKAIESNRPNSQFFVEFCNSEVYGAGKTFKEYFTGTKNNGDKVLDEWWHLRVIEELYSKFPKKNIYPIIFEDLIRNPNELNTLQDFIGVENQALRLRHINNKLDRSPILDLSDTIKKEDIEYLRKYYHEHNEILSTHHGLKNSWNIVSPWYTKFGIV